MNVHAATTMTIAEFAAWSQRQDRRFELVRGVPHMLPWVKRHHSTIVGNLDFALQSAIDRSRFSVRQGDFAVRTGPVTIRYADILVEPANEPGDARTAENAVVLAEVLSPSTMHEDFGTKREEYLGLSSLDTYLVLAQDTCHAWQWTRQADSAWPDDPLISDDMDARIAIPAIGVDIVLREVYRGVLE